MKTFGRSIAAGLLLLFSW